MCSKKHDFHSNKKVNWWKAPGYRSPAAAFRLFGVSTGVAVKKSTTGSAFKNRLHRGCTEWNSYPKKRWEKRRQTEWNANRERIYFYVECILYTPLRMCISLYFLLIEGCIIAWTRFDGYYDDLFTFQFFNTVFVRLMKSTSSH